MGEFPRTIDVLNKYHVSFDVRKSHCGREADDGWIHQMVRHEGRVKTVGNGFEAFIEMEMVHTSNTRLTSRS